MGYIRDCFTDDDVKHMAQKNIDLGTYDGVKTNATNIYIQTLQPDGTMPKSDPPPAPPRAMWSANRSQNFKTWILNKCPLGNATPRSAKLLAASVAVPSRLRKNVASLSGDEIALLKAAFEGIMALDSTDPGNQNAYFKQAGIHWLPAIPGVPQHCKHHVDQYNPWHRVYIRKFEDALRSIKGCESVTMPYWDIKTPVPSLLSEPPFDRYTAKQALGGGYPTPYTTARFDNATIENNLAKADVNTKIQNALKQSMWGSYDVGGFQQFIMYAHDDGHDSIGPTMQDPRVAAFDPIFWFFHCNWEREFLSWQTLIGATTLKGFLSTLSGDTGWLTFPALDPWDPITPDQTISEPDIGYDRLDAAAVTSFEHMVGSIDALQAFTIRPSAQVSVRVKNINRLAIPGTFVVYLLADGQPIAQQAFFQPPDPSACDNCSLHGLIPIDFIVDQKAVEGHKLSVKIEVSSHADIGSEFPLSQAGNPTINARLLLEGA
jgi:hypothetical protein